MSDTGKQSPLGVNSLNSLLLNKGLCINKVAEGYMGVSQNYSSYSPGSIVMTTCLRVLTYSINDAFNRKLVEGSGGGGGVYFNLYNIGTGTIPALGNTRAPTFTWGVDTYPKAWPDQSPNWNPYTVPNVGALTSWGYVRLMALQAWNEFNYNNTLALKGEYRDFLASYMQSSGFVDYSNTAITSVDNSKTFLNGTFSNMDDLITADITGVNTATSAFGQDLLKVGKAINLSTIASFGLPSNLLQTLQQSNALTQAVSLALLSTGLAPSDISTLAGGSVTPSSLQQQSIYKAFSLITGADLKAVLVPLNCALTITSLCDLLNPYKLFPASRSTLTVPVFNATGAGNSKVSYLIYSGSGLNSLLNSSTITAQVGTIILPGAPATVDQTTTTSQVSPTGFGSYLQGTGLPAEVATAAGAFGTAMQQVRNVSSVPIEKFAQIVVNLETTKGLPVAGTTIPTNQTLVGQALPLIALGSGPIGTYTMSNFFGCMSGLPYAWRIIQDHIKRVENSNLYRCYDEMYLAVTWEGALGHVIIERRERVIVPWSQGYNPQLYEPPVPYNPPRYTIDEPKQQIYQYDAVPYVAGITETTGKYEYDWHIVGIVLDNAGGGYGRGAQSNYWSYNPHADRPKVLITGGSGATAETIIQINPNAGGTNYYVPGPFGRVTSLFLTFTGNWVHYASTTTNAPYVSRFSSSGPTPEHPIPEVPNPPLVRIEFPPVGNGGSNSPHGTQGWPGMNPVIQGYINQANPEISRIKSALPVPVAELNLQWNSTGTQLRLEQRARVFGLPPLPVPRSDQMSSFPITQYSFVDAMPSYSKQIKPHMQCQTLEAITDMSTLGGPSMPAMMRETRNQERLIKAGISLDNNIEPELLPKESATLIGNGTLPTAVGNSGVVRDGVETTVRAFLEQVLQLPVDTSVPTLGAKISSVISAIGTVVAPDTTVTTVTTDGFTRVDPVTGSTIHRVTSIGTGAQVYYISGVQTTLLYVYAEVNPLQNNVSVPGSFITTILDPATNDDPTSSPAVKVPTAILTSPFIAYPPKLSAGDPVVFQSSIYTSNSGINIMPGMTYVIRSVGTSTFTSIGASSNVVGTSFVATAFTFTGTGTLTGTAMNPTNVVTPLQLVTGSKYVIYNAGSWDWTAQNASASTVGTIFVANGPAAAGSAVGSATAYCIDESISTGSTYNIKEVTDIPLGVYPKKIFSLTTPATGTTEVSFKTSNMQYFGLGTAPVPAARSLLVLNNRIYYTTTTTPITVGSSIIFTGGTIGSNQKINGTNIVSGITYYIKAHDVGSPSSSFTISTTLNGPVFDVGVLDSGTYRSEITSALFQATVTPGALSVVCPIICDSTADIAAGDTVAFSNMIINSASVTNFGNLIANRSYRVREIVNTTSFIVQNAGSTSYERLTPVAAGGTTGCDFIKIPAAQTAPVTSAAPRVSATAVALTVTGATARVFTVTSLAPPITAQVTQTVVTSNAIMANVTGFVVGNPVIFTGTTFGNIVSGSVYYILTIANNSFTVSATVGGTEFALVSATGTMTANVNTLIVCTSTALFKAGDTVRFTNMYINNVVVTNFGNLLNNGTVYTIAVIYSSTTFSVYAPGTSTTLVLTPVTAGSTTGCELIHLPSVAAVNTLNSTTVYTMPTTNNLVLYTNPTLNTAYPSTNLNIQPETGTVRVQIGTLYVVIPLALGSYDPATKRYIFTAQGNGPAAAAARLANTSGTVTTGNINNGTGTTINPSTGAVTNTVVTNPNLGTTSPIGTNIGPGSFANNPYQTILYGTPAPMGTPIEPGSFAGNPYQNLIPPELNTNLSSGTLLPSVPSIQEALDQIIKCNCDCWVVV